MLDKTHWETSNKVLFSRHGQSLEAHQYAFTLYVEERQAVYRPASHAGAKLLIISIHYVYHLLICFHD